MPAGSTRSKPASRPQADRSADTRSRVIAAAIGCLYQAGYSATTVSTVAAEAGVSRGAMTHQFPTKTELMVAVIRAVFEDDAEFYKTSVATLDPGRWLLALPETMWRVISRPSGIAVMEIMLASRSVPDLAEKLRTLQIQIDTDAHVWSVERVLAAGLKPHSENDAIHEVFVAAVRGLALNAVVMRSTENVHRSLAILAEMLRRFYPELNEIQEPAVSADAGYLADKPSNTNGH